MMRQPLLATVTPARALAEASLIGLVILGLLTWQAGRVSWSVISNGILLVWGMCALWPAMRTALPSGSRQRQVTWELALSVAVGLVSSGGLSCVTYLAGWDSRWPASSAIHPPTLSIVLLFAGPGYLMARLAVRLWLIWGRLRRRCILWQLTHTQLTAVFVLFLVTVSWFFLSAVMQSSPLPEPGQGAPAAIIEWLLRSVFPLIGIVSVIMLGILGVLFLPSAFVAFLTARRVTGRLEVLARATRAFRQGDYEARVAISGEDAVAQLEGDFNAMAAELQQTMHALREERDKVETLLQSQQQLIASVSHELRTPVTVIRSYLESDLSRWDDGLPAALKRDLETAERETVRLQVLIDDLFSLARARAGGLALDLRPTDVAAVIRRRVDTMAPPAWQSKRVAMSADLAPDLPQAMADEGRLAQVLANLLRNAVRYTTPGGIIVVTAAGGEYVRIDVRDTGEGIAPADLPHIWTRFYQGAPAQAAHDGAGLGLALVKELTEAMGGTVSVESTPGQGSCFSVRLRRADRM